MNYTNHFTIFVICKICIFCICLVYYIHQTPHTKHMSFQEDFKESTELMQLSQYEKMQLANGYIKLLTDIEHDYWRTFVCYMLLTNVITIGSVLITSFIPIEKMASLSPTAATAMSWTIWAMALAVTLSNKWMLTFSIHKKYALYNNVLDKFKAEGRQFTQGIARYANLTHADRFPVFCTRIEKLKAKHSESLAGLGSQTEMSPTQDDPLLTTPKKPPTALKRTDVVIDLIQNKNKT